MNHGQGRPGPGGKGGGAAWEPRLAATVTHISDLRWRVTVTDPLLYLSHTAAGTVRTLVGRVEWHTPTQKFRAVLDEVRQTEPDGTGLSMPLYLTPGAAQAVRQLLIVAWIDHWTDPALYSAHESPVSEALGGQIPLPTTGQGSGQGGGEKTAQKAASGSGPAPRRRGPIRSPLSSLVDPEAAQQEAAFGEIELMIEQMRGEAE